MKTKVAWFCAAHGNVGIVQVNDVFDGYKYYIGASLELDEDKDVEHITKWGSSFPKPAGDKLFRVEE